MTSDPESLAADKLVLEVTLIQRQIKKATTRRDDLLARRKEIILALIQEPGWTISRVARHIGVTQRAIRLSVGLETRKPANRQSA